MNKWIKVEEKLPNENSSVLVWCPEYKNIYCAYRNNGVWFIFCDSLVVCNEKVTHWMLVPKPQEE